jgi:hypothetical protein
MKGGGKPGAWDLSRGNKGRERGFLCEVVVYEDHCDFFTFFYRVTQHVDSTVLTFVVSITQLSTCM